MLPSNVHELRAEEARRRRSGRRANLRPLLLLPVLAVLLAGVLLVSGAAAEGEGQPALGAIGHGAQMAVQAAETAIARRSRLPGPGDPESEQWKQSGATRLLVVAVLAGGVILFVKTRLR